MGWLKPRILPIDGRALQRTRDKNDKNEMLEDFTAYEFLKSHKNCAGKIRVVGFYFGGWISNMTAVIVPTLSEAILHYGRQTSEEETAQIHLIFMKKSKRQGKSVR
jgi:carboxymethylenebutenolidase